MRLGGRNNNDNFGKEPARIAGIGKSQMACAGQVIDSKLLGPHKRVRAFD